MPRTSASRGWSCGKRYRRYSPDMAGPVLDDAVVEDAEPLDLDLDDVAGLEQPPRVAGVTDAGRRAGGEQVAGAQREGVRDQRERVADGVDHLVGGAVLDGLAVDPGLHAQALPQVAHLGGRDQRPERAGVVAVLAEDPLAGQLLRRPGGDVVEGRVTDDGGQRLVRSGVDQRAADVGHDLALPVDALLVGGHRYVGAGD